MTRVKRCSSCSKLLFFFLQGRVAIITAFPKPRGATCSLIPSSKTRSDELYEIFIRCVHFPAVRLSLTEKRRRRRRGGHYASFLPASAAAAFQHLTRFRSCQEQKERPGKKKRKKEKHEESWSWSKAQRTGEDHLTHQRSRTVEEHHIRMALNPGF